MIHHSELANYCSASASLCATIPSLVFCRDGPENASSGGVNQNPKHNETRPKNHDESRNRRKQQKFADEIELPEKHTCRDAQHRNCQQCNRCCRGLTCLLFTRTCSCTFTGTLLKVRQVLSLERKKRKTYSSGLTVSWFADRWIGEMQERTESI
jgi:hypothetical protein